MSESNVAVVVVTHNSAGTVGRCLDVLLRCREVAEVQVVDNASSDDWRAHLPADPRIRSVQNPGNPGFATACNQGAAATRAPWLLFLNPDCFLEGDALARLLQVARQVPDLGVLGAELVGRDGIVDPASRRRTPTPQAVFGGHRTAPADPAAAGAVAPFERVGAISGALMLMPRAAFDTVGGFDAGYRLHCEDLDLCRRLLDAGLTVAVAGGVRVLHLRGTSSRARPLWVEWQKHRGMLRYFRKFDARAAGPLLRLLVPLAIGLRLPLAALRAWWRARQANDGAGGNA